MPVDKTKTPNGNSLNSQKSVNDAVKSICDIMRRGNVTSAVQYVPELTWILFLRVLDEIEQEAQEEAAALGLIYKPPLAAPYRWRDWAAPDGATRKQLEESSSGDAFAFANRKLIPYLKGLENRAHATVRQKVISEIMSGVERVRVDTERNFLDVLDRVHRLRCHTIDKTHVFSLSQVYEGLLLKMGEKNNDGGQFFTPRQVIRAMVRAIDPRIGETVYDPGSGTDGFLAQSYEHIKDTVDKQGATGEQYTTLQEHTFYGREKENLIYPIALANLVLHGIDHPPRLARQHPYRQGELWRSVRGRAGAVRGAHQSSFWRKGRKGRANPLRLQDQLHPGTLPATCHQQPQNRWALWHRGR